jgi:hypothetical protein
MSDKIKELMLEAKLGPALLLHYWKNIDALTDSEQEDLEQIEKLAELIVKECISVVTSKCASPTARNALIEHFGVEK